MSDATSSDDADLIAALVRDLVGSDPVRCGEAQAHLTALGGFSRPEIRAALERALSRPSTTPRRTLALPAPRPHRVGTYALGECIGRGGFGIVRRARDLGGDESRELCVKLAYAAKAGAPAITRFSEPDQISSRGVPVDRILAEALCDRPGAFEEGEVDGDVAAAVLHAESALLATLEGDLFPEVVSSGLHDGIAWYAMEFVHAPDLRRVMHAPGTSGLDLRRLLKKLLREMDGLRERRGDFFHGDLKPENILVTPTRLRLIDPAFRGGAHDPITATLSVPYNPLGLSGEAADTMALAITWLELLTGVQPLRARDRIWRPSDGLDPVGALGLDAFADAAASDPLVAKLVRFVERPPTYREFADAL